MATHVFNITGKEGGCFVIRSVDDTWGTNPDVIATSFEDGVVTLDVSAFENLQKLANFIAGCLAISSNFKREVLLAFGKSEYSTFSAISFTFQGIKLIVDNPSPSSICSAFNEAVQKCRTPAKSFTKKGIDTLTGKIPFLYKDSDSKKYVTDRLAIGDTEVASAMRWAKYMQYLMQRFNKPVDEVANKAKADCYAYGTNEYAYACMVFILAKCWKYGQDLLIWHNRRWGYQGTDGVFDPSAVIGKSN